jgi:hypothetical protein
MPAPDYAVEIGKLETAYANNVDEVEMDGERIKFSSAGDMLKRIQYFKSLAASNAQGNSAGATLACFRGY